MFFVASLKPCHGKTQWDKKKTMIRKKSTTTLTIIFLSLETISSGYAFQSTLFRELSLRE